MSLPSKMVPLAGYERLLVKQVRELAELFGFETRNKYQISNESGEAIAFAAEQGKGILGFLFRQYLGHWRSFTVTIFNQVRQPVLTCHHPFRFFFDRINVKNQEGRTIGAIQKRFSIFSKKFDIENEQGRVLLEVASPFFRIWSFDFKNQGRSRAKVSKKWGGVLKELFTDTDTFLIEYNDPALSEDERQLVMAAAIFVDLLYFEKAE